MTTPSEIASRLSEAQRSVIRRMTGEYSPPPRGVTRQAVAALECRHSSLVQREWPDGCAGCTYYRLTPLGLAVRAILEEQKDV